jgi:murein L,D-transpeptidase YcbB/YkuD
MRTAQTLSQALTLTAAVTLALALVSGGTGLEAREPSLPAAEPAAGPLLALLERPDAAPGPDPRAAAVREALERFYRAGGYRPSWFDERGRPIARVEALLEALESADRDGLRPGDYRPDLLARELRRLAPEADPAALHRADLLLSAAFARLVHDLAAGRVDPDDAGAQWFLGSRRPDLAAALHQAVYGDGGVETTLAALRPAHPGYERLRQALERYREIVRAGGWPVVPEGPVLSAGKRADAARLEALAARLAAEGDLDRDAPAGRGTYDETLAAAVRRFQERLGLEADGAVGPATLAALNVPARERLRQLELNLERWRWVPAELPARRVEIDLPAFRLRLVEDGRTVSAMKVVVGKRGSRTPIFRDSLTHVVLNPYWNVPPGIAARELRPKGSAYLAARGYETVAGGGLRQRPGPGNSLGRVKFVLDNQQLIYLHDTPEKHLFGRAERAFSHGCIRLERPLELAEWALRDHPEWSPERLRAAVARGRHDWIPLPREIPVYVLYFTTWAEDDGRAHFRRDLYGFDDSLAQALERRHPEPSTVLLAAGS